MSSPIAESAGRLGHGPVHLAAEDLKRRRRMLAAWRRRSVLVKIVRVLLPLAGLAMLAALIGLAGYNALYRRLNAAPSGVNQSIRMLNPQFQGRNDSGRPFILSADSAVRDDADSQKVTLDKPVLSLGAGGPDLTTVRSRHGVYREDTRMLDLTGNVHLDDAQGRHFITEHALIDTQKNNVDGEQAVEGHGPLGRINASSYSLKDGGARVVFTGRVKSRLESRGVAAVRPDAAAQK
jgi:lipopolysaccharide export system protein LptC